MIDILAIVIGGLVGAAWVAALVWRAREDAKDPYGDWVREAQINTPGFEPPYVMVHGHYVENPRWQPHQTIRHTDGTETRL